MFHCAAHMLAVRPWVYRAGSKTPLSCYRQVFKHPHQSLTPQLTFPRFIGLSSASSSSFFSVTSLFFLLLAFPAPIGVFRLLVCNPFGVAASDGVALVLFMLIVKGAEVSCIET
jgi:hypothetical protein